MKRLMWREQRLGAVLLITFPMITPLIVTNLVYTIIGSFTAMNNELILLLPIQWRRVPNLRCEYGHGHVVFRRDSRYSGHCLSGRFKRTFYHV